jgi:hypothetical protein
MPLAFWVPLGTSPFTHATPAHALTPTLILTGQVCMRIERPDLFSLNRVNDDGGLRHGSCAASPDGSGCAAPATAVAGLCEGVVRFPYAILEVKLADGDSCPQWVLVGGKVVENWVSR